MHGLTREIAMQPFAVGTASEKRQKREAGVQKPLAAFAEPDEVTEQVEGTKTVEERQEEADHLQVCMIMSTPINHELILVQCGADCSQK